MTRRTVTPKTIRISPHGTDWHDDASCLGHDPEFWFQDQDHAYALAICAQCPVRVACGQHALALPERDGVWGGMTAAERDALRRRRTRTRRNHHRRVS